MSVSRRHFVRTTTFATAAVVGASVIGPRSVYGLSPFVRRNIGNLRAADPPITAYKAAITAMQALPHTDPVSWLYQGAIHGTSLPDNLTAWNTCEHGTYFFLSWHRMYLYFFERIVRKLSGDPNWALPYWDYENPAQRQLPSMFRSPGNATNPLWTTNRGFGWNDGTSFLDASAVDSSGALGEVPFIDFSSWLEGTPHAAVHIAMDSWMGAFETAALDPIFWLHHCNIDRYWNVWLKMAGGRSNPLGSSASDVAWKNTKFTFFDENGTQVQMSGCDILRAQDQLGYVYECEPIQRRQNCRLIWFPSDFVIEVLIAFPLERRRLVLPPQPDPVPYDIPLDKLRERVRTIAADDKTELVLQLEVEADRQPDVYWEVYAGLPDNTKPNAASPHYVGNIAMFAHGIRNSKHQHGEFKPARFTFRLDRAVTALLKRNPEAKSLRFTFVARGAAGTPFRTENKATVTVTSASIAARRLNVGRGEDEA